MRKVPALALTAGALTLAASAGADRREVSPGCTKHKCAARVCVSNACRARVESKAPHRRTVASWYGPGLYGNALACGGRLSPGTLGVAHKTLRCGTRVHVCAQRCVSVAVIDRGPFVAGREFDLTAATAQAIGFGGVGVVRVRVAG